MMSDSGGLRRLLGRGDVRLDPAVQDLVEELAGTLRYSACGTDTFR
jgi:hypothetical protein